MKFAEHLSAHITPEWRKQYILYEEMKTMLYSAIRKLHTFENYDDHILSRQLINFEEEFFQFCDNELHKIDVFFSEKLAEATRKYATLTSDLKLVFSNVNDLKKKSVSTKKLREAKLAFSEFYLNLVLLQNYQQLNSTGFRKICKKHDKLLNLDSGSKWFKNHIEISKFVVKQSEIDNLITNVENFVTNELENGNRPRAMKRLRVPPLGEHQLPWITFKVGLFFGAFIILFFVIIVSLNANQFNDLAIVTQLFRGPFLIILFLFLIGLNLYGWRSAGVNHVLIFELDPRNHLTEQNFMEFAGVWAVISSLICLNFLYSSVFHIPRFCNPYMFIAMILAFLINPTKTCYHQSRFWFLKLCLRIFLAPLFYVRFADFWLADQLCSLTVIFLDLQYLVCFAFSRFQINFQDDMFFILHQTLGCLPAWFRFAQCVRRFCDSGHAFPHLLNAIKYATTFLVAISYYFYWENNSSNILFYIWLTCLIINSLYSYIWDIKMDWGLLDNSEKKEYRFLREEIIYPVNFYYFAIIEDFLLRFSWVLKVGNELIHVVNDVYLKTLLYFLEIIRRFIWNFFRLENEHLNNCGQFRAVRDISIAPINKNNDENKIIHMMDEFEGVINRRSRKIWPSSENDYIKLPLI